MLSDPFRFIRLKHSANEVLVTCLMNNLPLYPVANLRLDKWITIGSNSRFLSVQTAVFYPFEEGFQSSLNH